MGGTTGMGGETSESTTNTTNTATTGANATCSDPREPAQAAASGSTGAFGTTDAVCYFIPFVPADFAGWGCSNFAGPSGSGERSITVNGEPVGCGDMPLPDPIDGGYYFEFGPGNNTQADVYWFNWE